jgi:hypothetical protein
MPGEENTTEVRRSPWILRLVIPLAAGILIDGASELVKKAAHYQREQFEGTGRDFLGALFLWALAIGIVALSTYLFEKFSDPDPIVRNVLLFVALVLVGGSELWEVLLRDEMVKAYGQIQVGWSLHQINRIVTEEPLVVSHDESFGSCTGKCWLTLSYRIPTLWGRRYFDVDLDKDLVVISKMMDR